MGCEIVGAFVSLALLATPAPKARPVAAGPTIQVHFTGIVTDKPLDYHPLGEQMTEVGLHEIAELENRDDIFTVVLTKNPNERLLATHLVVPVVRQAITLTPAATPGLQDAAGILPAAQNAFNAIKKQALRR